VNEEGDSQLQGQVREQFDLLSYLGFWISRTATLIPFSARSLVAMAPMPSLPPVTTTISFFQSYLSLTQLLAAPLLRKLLMRFHTPRARHTCRALKRRGLLAAYAFPDSVYSPARYRGNVLSGLRAVYLRRLLTTSRVKPEQRRVC